MSPYEEIIKEMNPSIHDAIKDIDDNKYDIFRAVIYASTGEQFISSYQVKKVLEHLANPTLNGNQQVVLDYGKTIDIYDFLQELSCNHYQTPENVTEAMNSLDKNQLAQVIQLFSAWVQEQEGE